MSLQLETIALISAGLAVGVLAGFIITMKVFSSFAESMTEKVIDKLTQEIDDPDSPCYDCPYGGDEDGVEDDGPPVVVRIKDSEQKEKDYKINGSVQNYIHETGYDFNSLEDEK